MSSLLLLVRLLLGGIFLMSAITKLAAPGEFAANVQKYQILPRPLATAYARVLPFAELGAGGLLLLGFYPVWAASAGAFMLLSFMAAVGIAMARRQHLDCSCFGLLYRERVGWGTQARDAALLAFAVFVLMADDGSLTIGYLITNASHPGYALALLATLAILGFSLYVGYLTLRQAQQQHSFSSASLQTQVEG